MLNTLKEMKMWICWSILLIPALASLSFDPLFLAWITLLLFAYLIINTQIARRYLILVWLLYSLLMWFPPYMTFLRPFFGGPFYQSDGVDMMLTVICNRLSSPRILTALIILQLSMSFALYGLLATYRAKKQVAP